MSVLNGVSRLQNRIKKHQNQETHRQEVGVDPLGVHRVRVQDQQIRAALVGGVADRDARVVRRLGVEGLLEEPDGARIRPGGLQGRGDGLEPRGVGLGGRGGLVDEEDGDCFGIVGFGQRACRGERGPGRRRRGRRIGVPGGTDEGDEQGVILEGRLGCVMCLFFSFGLWGWNEREGG